MEIKWALAVNIARGRHIPLKNKLVENNFWEMCFSMVHIGRNTFMEIISWKYKLGCFYFSVWTCFQSLEVWVILVWMISCRSIAAFQLFPCVFTIELGGAGRLPLLSRRCANEGSTEASSPLLSKPFILVFDECVTVVTHWSKHIHRNNSHTSKY